MSKAILILDEMPEDCKNCLLAAYIEESDLYYCSGEFNRYLMESVSDLLQGFKPDWCPLHEAIGYVEPSGNVVYLEPRHCDDCRHCNWNPQDGEHFCTNDASPYFARATTGTCKYWEAEK